MCYEFFVSIHWYSHVRPTSELTVGQTLIQPYSSCVQYQVEKINNLDKDKNDMRHFIGMKLNIRYWDVVIGIFDVAVILFIRLLNIDTFILFVSTVPVDATFFSFFYSFVLVYYILTQLITDMWFFFFYICQQHKV